MKSGAMKSKGDLTILAVLAGFLFPAACAADDVCAQHVMKGIRLFEDMSYDASLAELQAALREGNQCSDREAVNAHLFIAQIQIVLGKQEEAKEEMKAALRVNPLLSMDPQTTSPKVLKVLNEAREEMHKEKQTPLPASTPVSEKESNPMRTAAWITGGTALGSAIASGIFLSMAYNEDAKQKQTADDGDWDAHDEHWARTKTYASAFYALGGLAVVTGVASVTLFLLSGKNKNEQQKHSAVSITAAPLITDDLTGISVRFRF